MGGRPLAAVDPGREKCGFAVLDAEGAVLCQKVIETLNLEREIADMYARYAFTTLVLGNGTTSREARARIERVMPELLVVLVDEYRTTDMAKRAYWQARPPRGWRRLLPVTMLVPPEPVDDFVAVILARRFLEKVPASLVQRGASTEKRRVYMAEKDENLEVEAKEAKKAAKAEKPAEALKSEKAVKFDAMLKELDIQAFQKQEVGDEYGTVLYRSSMEIKGQFLPVIVILDASIYGIVRVIVGSKVVNEKNESDLAAYINEMNSRYKVFKYYTVEDGSLVLDACLPASDEAFEPDIVRTILDVILQHLDETFGDTMKTIWADN